MWQFVVLVVMTMLTGVYSLREHDREADVEQATAESVAGEMAVYREAVITWFSENPNQLQPVPIDTLRSNNLLPVWSTLRTNPAASIWANFRDADGLIYIYATTLPRVNIVNEVAKLSQNSVLAGVFRTGDATLHSPVFGNTGIKLPPAGVPIPNGSPVWIALRR